jgi:hypothetical protein
MEYKKVTAISGPVSLYVYSYNNSTYYFFGDEHFSNADTCEDYLFKCDYLLDKHKSVNLESNCTDLGALFHNWFTYNNDYNISTNFYMETPFTKKDVRKLVNTQHGSWLTRMEYVLEDCLTTNKSTCPYAPSVRVHYVDIRTFEAQDQSIHVDLFSLHPIQNYITTSKTDKSTLKGLMHDYLKILNFLINNYSHILTGILDVHYDEIIDYIVNFAQSLQYFTIYTNYIEESITMTVIRNDIRIHRVAASLNKLKAQNPIMVDYILHYIYDLLDNHMAHVKEQYDLDFGTFFPISNLYNLFDKYDQLMMLIDSYIFDAYLLSRMFYNDDNNIEVITYTGYAHTERYNYFFQHYLYADAKIILHKKNEQGTRCVYSKIIPNYLDINKFRKHAYIKEQILLVLKQVDNNNTFDNSYITLEKHNDVYTLTDKSTRGTESTTNKITIMQLLYSYFLI